MKTLVKAVQRRGCIDDLFFHITSLLKEMELGHHGIRAEIMLAVSEQQIYNCNALHSNFEKREGDKHTHTHPADGKPRMMLSKRRPCDWLEGESSSSLVCKIV